MEVLHNHNNNKIIIIIALYHAIEMDRFNDVLTGSR